MKTRDIYISENRNMWYGNVPSENLLNDVKFHLSPKGTSVLAGNIKHGLHSALRIRENSIQPKYRDQ